MIEIDEQLHSFRAEVPPPTPSAWTHVRAVMNQAIDVELKQLRQRRWIKRRSSPKLLLTVLAGLCLTGVAACGATALIGEGSPAPNPQSTHTPARVNILGLRVADPAGGPPWGIRLALSHPINRRHGGTGPDVAIQLGRIRGNQMGFIGVDNAFHNDGLFHAAGPNSALISPANYPIPGTPHKPDLQRVYHFALTLPAATSAINGCSTIKVRRKLPRSLASSVEHRLATLRTDGPAAKRLARKLRGSVQSLLASYTEILKRWRIESREYTSERTYATCPRKDLRTIIIGFAGPTTTSITINGLGAKQTETLAPDDDGFYLFVLPHKWSYASRYHAALTCQDGHTVNGLAAPGTPDAPRCPADRPRPS